MSEFQITPLEDETKRTWRLVLDGKLLEPQPKLVEVVSDEWGKIVIGMWPQGFHKWAFYPGKNGTVTIPYCWTPGKSLLLGLLHEYRPNMGGKILGPLGGAVEVGESCVEAGHRESMEEGGLDTGGATQLPGVAVNADRFCYVQDATLHEGLTIYGLEIPFSMLEHREEAIWPWSPKEGTVASSRESDLVFLPWKDAVRLSPDGVALAAIARLLAVLIDIP